MFEKNFGYSSSITKAETWKENDSDDNRVIRRIINSAIYVEEPLIDMPPYRNGPLAQNYRRVPKTKYCKCYSDPENCPFHASETKETFAMQESNCTSSNCLTACESSATIKSNKMKLALNSRIQSSVKLSQTSLFTDEHKEKEDVLKQWLAKKTEQRKVKQLEEAKVKEEQERQKELVIEKERESFKKWLMEKKREEVLKKYQREAEMNEQKVKEERDRKRDLENKLSYNLWLQRKKKQDLERKIDEKTRLLKVYEEKQTRIEDNKKAFHEWLENSKNKPRPIPLNQGLRSLCSSMSVTYINPVPWNPNIEIEQKPGSQ